MNRRLYYVSAITILCLTLSACQGATQTPAPATEPAATEQAATLPPATEPLVTEAPTLQPIDLAGPVMELGSKYMHVDGAYLVAVPGGPFKMGSAYFGDKEHVVTLSDFWIYSSKVTNAEYARCLNAGICTSPNLDNNKSFGNPLDISLPVTGVNYEQAAAYCSFVHGRLPTEAEWEKTARGPDGNIYPWGDAVPACDLLNFHFCKGKPTDVTKYPTGSSYYSALDMSGNTREWVADFYDAKYYEVSPDLNPTGPDSGEKRSVRGSSFGDSFDPSMSAHRWFLNPLTDQPDLGFRCVVDDPTFFAPYCQTLVLAGADENGAPTDAVIPTDCVQPLLSSAISCDDQATYVKLETFPLPQGAQLTVPQGDPTGECFGGPNDQVYKCVGKGAVSVKAEKCKAPLQSGDIFCAPGYALDEEGTACLAKGPGESCLPGFNFDPAAQCCVAADPAAAAIGVCPAGFFQYDNACVPIINNPPSLQDVKIPFFPVDCSVGDDPNAEPDPGDTSGCTETCIPIRGKPPLCTTVCP